ncbi:Stress responsive A/B Barrel Domain [Novymonas esmeraldas]|uniref:Stress responsive A/B Barrel Domain n=1 Tax=Novymonas esmeraldas TaxID=1808958 RepID=A0AAW0F5C9_9TRYP
MATVIHIALFKLNAERMAVAYPGNALEEDIDTLRHGAVPGLIDIQFKPKDAEPWIGYVDGSKGYTHALVSRHESKEALRQYMHDDHHHELQKRMDPCVEEAPLRMEIVVGGESA